MTATIPEIAHWSVAERKSAGQAARERTPASSHAGWRPATDRPDPVDLLLDQDKSREPDLVPVRHGRMMVSPFTFYRGAAKIMAVDLKDTPAAGLHAQLCGDAHLSNFGAFASPDRILLFDVNDFDETLPGPFEYDVKRMAASFTIAARNNGFSTADTRAATLASVRAYREAMAGFAQMGTMEIWYAHLDEDEVMSSIRTVAGTAGGAKSAKQAKGKKEKAGGKDAKLARKAERRAQKTVVKAHASDSLHALSKLGEMVNGRYQIVSQPPIVVPVREMATTYGQDFVTRYHLSPDEVMPAVQDQFRAYRATLQPDRQLLLDRYEIVDMARKVVGVGSVGTRAFIVLLQGRDANDPLFLQVKEATSSVLESHLPKSRFRNHGERVVQGQRLMQAASDIYLGWTKGHDVRRHFYWRQLRDMKASAVVEAMTPLGLGFYAQMCGWTLARAHARSGDPVAIAEYLGTGDAFDNSVTDFSVRYADQNERDYQKFEAAVRSGRVAAVEGLLSGKLTRQLSGRNLHASPTRPHWRNASLTRRRRDRARRSVTTRPAPACAREPRKAKWPAGFLLCAGPPVSGSGPPVARQEVRTTAAVRPRVRRTPHSGLRGVGATGAARRR